MIVPIIRIKKWVKRWVKNKEFKNSFTNITRPTIKKIFLQNHFSAKKWVKR